MPDDEFQNAVAAAMSSTRADDVIDGIKAAVIAELKSLDPSVAIRSTDYFNHSFAPDLVLRWGSKEYREVYLRYNLRSASAGRDIELLRTGEPVLLSLNSSSDDDDDEVKSDIAEEVRRNPGTLVTNTPAIDSISVDSTIAQTASISTDAAVSETAHPLISLFNKNIVRGGRGLVTEDTASKFQAPPEGVPSEVEAAYAERFSEMASEVLREDTALQVRRASELIRVALTGDLGILDLQRPTMDEEVGHDVPSGNLTQDEVHALIPYLLRRSRTSIDPQFWAYLGSMISLRQFEEMADSLDGADISDFVRANMSDWRARRSLLAINSDAIDAEEAVSPSWTFRSKMLCASAGTWNAFFAWDRRKGGWREDSLLARWDEVRPSLTRVSLSGVELQGVVRSVRVTADSGLNLLADATQIQTSIEDDFRVRSVDVRASVEDSSDIHLDFASMTGSGTEVPLSDLVNSTFNVLGHRFPLSDSEFDSVATPSVN